MKCTICGSRTANPLCPYCWDDLGPPDPDAFEAAKAAAMQDEIKNHQADNPDTPNTPEPQ